jgi:hypothetical protein
MGDVFVMRLGACKRLRNERHEGPEVPQHAYFVFGRAVPRLREALHSSILSTHTRPVILLVIPS